MITRNRPEGGGRITRELYDAAAALRRVAEEPELAGLIDQAAIDLIRIKLLAQITVAAEAPRARRSMKRLGPASVRPKERGWVACCEVCGAESPWPREKISAALEWWHEHLTTRDCDVDVLMPA